MNVSTTHSRLVAIVTLTLVFISVLGGFSCESIEDNLARYVKENLEINVDEIRLSKMGLTGAELVADVRINNRADKTIDIIKLEYDVYYQGRVVASGINNENWQLKSARETTKEMPVSISYLDATSILLNLPNDSLATVKGTATCVTVLGKQDYPFEVNTEIIGG